jgi:hypothetical protein
VEDYLVSTEITTAFVKEYNAGVRLLQQQMPSRLREAVMVDSDVEGDRAFFDQVDATVMNEVTNRHGDTEYTDTPHRRRMVTLKTYEVADLVDRADRRRILNDPINPYTRSMAAAANRRLDDIILAAMDATASTGVDGATSTAFDTNFSFSEASATNFGHADLITGRRILEAAENEEDDGDHRWYIVCSANQRENLLSDSVIQSIDTNTVRALVNGQIDTYMGMTFIKSQRSAIDGSNIRDVFMWVKASMQLAISQEPRSFMDVLPQKRHSIQVRHELDAGSTRMDEKGVVRCLADES